MDFCRPDKMKCLKYQDQRLRFGPQQHDLTVYESSYRAPIYIYEWSGIERRVQKLKEVFKNQAQLHYAMKANSLPEILRRLHKTGCGVDTVSIGEVLRAIECGIPPEKIIFSGVGKTSAELEKALELKLHQINVESLPELQRLLHICQNKKKKVALALRLNPNVDAKTHPYITTGSKNNKFGIDDMTAGECLRLIEKNRDFLQLQGLTVHVGSQILDVSVFESAVQWLTDFARDCKGQGFAIQSLDIGGGLGIHYDKDDLAGEESLAESYAKILLKHVDTKSYKLLLEPGRWLVAHSGVLISRVEYVKKTSQKNFMILDTGVHHLLRPALYGALHRIFPIRQGEASEKFDVVGPLCESSDVLARDVMLPPLKEGDLLAISDAGAYGYEMASEYNLRERPAQILLD